MRREVLTWNDVDQLIDHLIPQLDGEFDSIVMITRGGIVPAGLLAAATQIEEIFVASVNFPAQFDMEKKALMAWPQFLQFPEDRLLTGKRILVIDDVWASGRTITAVKNKVSVAGGHPNTCVMHFDPHRNLFDSIQPDYYAAVTDAYIVYPWEIERGPEAAFLKDF